MVKHNNVVPNVHLRKHWERGVGAKTHFNQPAQKVKRNKNRIEKARKMFPRPANSLRPIVSQTTRKYAGKHRYGRGFTLAELKQAKIPKSLARTIGIAVDHRRTSSSHEQLMLNAARLEAYRSKLVLFPRKENKPRKGLINDSTAEQLKQVVAAHNNRGVTMPRKAEAAAVETVDLTKTAGTPRAFHALRSARTNTRYEGRRAKRAADEAEKNKNK
jgi:large subunit ribosomal protein L13e